LGTYREEDDFDIWNDRPTLMTTNREDFSDDSWIVLHNTEEKGGKGDTEERASSDISWFGPTFNKPRNLEQAFMLSLNYIKTKFEIWWDKVWPQMKEALAIRSYSTNTAKMGVTVTYNCIVIFAIDSCATLHVFYVCLGLLVMIE